MPQKLIQKYGPEPNRYYMRYIEALSVISMNLAVLVYLTLTTSKEKYSRDFYNGEIQLDI
jgi:predicted peroxiredoxin